MTDLTALRDRVAGLAGPDRGVDGLIARDLLGWLPYFDLEGDDLLHWPEMAGHWHLPGDPCDGRHSVGDERNPDPDEFTASIDAAVALIERVLPGRQWKLEGANAWAGDFCWANVHPAEQPFPAHLDCTGLAPLPALALLLATIDAKIAQEGE